jgi:iron complex outermembrane receptor protein
MLHLVLKICLLSHPRFKSWAKGFKSWAIYKYILLFTCSLLATACLYSQECGQIALEQAQKEYEVGRLSQVISLIKPCLDKGFTNDEKIQAYRLLALTYLANDNTDSAGSMIERILQIDPSYTPNTVFDPQRYQVLVESIRKPVTSLVTASRQVEPLNEAPVPVTVITEEMIMLSGARTLKELLSIYVPGMTNVEDHNEYNISMRGVYASSQQKILIMLNGHRLNSRAYSEANPDFSQSLDKIRQIEVLRGPASSLYGNVALTSVINIITKKGQDINGVKVSAGVGNYGQFKADVLLGKQFDRYNDLMIWGSFYQSDGQKIHVSKEKDYSQFPKEGYAIIGGFKDNPSYDAGVIYSANNLSLMANMRYCKYIEPFSSGGITGEVYNYDEYRTFQDIGPGLGSRSSHLDASYGKDFGKGWDIYGNATLDFNSIEGSLVMNPDIGQSGKVFWNEYSYGGVLQLKKQYTLGHLGKGNVLAGAQIDGMKLLDSFFLVGINGEFDTTMDNSSVPLLEKGIEIIYSGFFQIKHKFGQKFILNLGARYDNKKRHKGENIGDFSPRLSLIYTPSSRADVKLSYAKSFVDAPYWYRYNSLPGYKGSENLLPEHLTSLQLTTNLRFHENKYAVGINIFYNKLRDFIYRDPESTGTEPRYRNAGRLESTGIEGEFGYLAKLVRFRANLTWQYALDAVDYGVTNERIHNIPGLSGNIILDINPLFKKSQNLWLDLTLHCTGSELSPINTYKNGIPFQDPGNEVSPAAILNAGLHVIDLNGFFLDFTIYNLFDSIYEQGGSVNFPYPQQGRWFLMKVGYKFRN